MALGLLGTEHMSTLECPKICQDSKVLKVQCYAPLEICISGKNKVPSVCETVLGGDSSEHTQMHKSEIMAQWSLCSLRK